MGVFQLFLNDVLGYKVVVHVHGYRSPSNLLGQITIHKAQGLILDKVVIDIGKEFSAGLMLCVHVCVASQTCLTHHLLTNVLQASLRACS